jgi:hypothetical protein
MKRLAALIGVSLISFSALAMDASQVQSTTPQVVTTIIPAEQISPRNELVEAGFMVSSINSGSSFVTATIGHEFSEWFTLGLRGLVPLAFDEKAQVYEVQANARINLLNDENVIYGEGQLTQGFFNGDYDTEPFGMIGVSAGYARKLPEGFSVGVSYGIDYSSSRVRDSRIYELNSIYNKLALTGGYYF